MYIELDLDHNALITLGYVISFALLMRGAMALFDKNNRGKKGKK